MEVYYVRQINSSGQRIHFPALGGDGEIGFDLLAVDDDVTGAFDDPNAGDGAFAAAGRPESCLLSHDLPHLALTGH